MTDTDPDLTLLTLQDRDGYQPLKRRSDLVRATLFARRLGAAIIMASPILAGVTRAPMVGLIGLAAGILTLALEVVIHLVTLPVEYNASNRARGMLQATGLVTAREYDGASAVLSAAALTYVAALLQAVAQLFYFVLLAVGMGRR